MKATDNLGRLTLVKGIMIAAQVIITGFAFHWLTMQYRERRQEVIGEISAVWESAEQMMIDSMLMKQYIAPALDSTTHYNFNFEFDTDTIRKVITSAHIGKDGEAPSIVTLPARKSQIIISLNDSVAEHRVKQQTNSPGITRNLVLQGVKLFINTHGDSTVNRTATVADWQMKPDTSLLMDSLSRRLKMLDPGIRTGWITDSLQGAGGNAQKIQFRLITANDELEAGIEGFSTLVFRGLWPQLLFALLLVVVTATAFIFSFRSMKEQVLLNNQRSGFIRNMSHELKTPVATVKVALEALKKYNRRDPAVMDEYLSIAATETERLEQLIARVMQVSEVNDRVIGYTPENVSMDELIQEVLQSFRPRFEEDNTMVTYLPPAEPVIALADRLHLQGVLINLLDNSLKYSEPPARIEIGLSAEEGSIRVSVADRGKGIPAAYHQRIFEKFFRVPTGDLHNVKGYGLGLAYAEMVIRQHRGKIICRNNPEGGTIFEFTIPVSQA